MISGISLAAAFLALFIIIHKRPRLRLSRAGWLKSVVAGLTTLNVLIMLGAIVLLFSGTTMHAQEAPPGQRQEQPSGSTGLRDVAAAIAIGLATIGAGIAVAVTGSAAIGGMTRNPEVFGRSLVFVGLAEGIAIYGLIIAFMILIG